MAVTQIEAATIGEGWLAVSREVLERGVAASWGGLETREVPGLTLEVERPATDDPVITELGDPAWLAWMHDNFFVRKGVPELGGARSYAARLFDYGAAGRDQLAWVIDRLRADRRAATPPSRRSSRSTDTTYIPCVSLLDFWCPGGAVELVVYAHGLDFGKKAYGNLVELAHLSEHVAGALGRPVGRLTLHVKTAHVYATEWELMAELSGADGNAV